MAKSTEPYMGFRPQINHEAAWFVLRHWCDKNNVKISGVFNALIPFLKIATMQTADVDDDGDITIEVNFGTIKITNNNK